MGLDTELRVGQYRKNEEGECRLQELNALLAPLETKATRSFDRPRQAVIFLVGAPRSGSTVLSQVMAQSSLFGYTSNFVARFWAAPYIGARIEQALGIRQGHSISSFRSTFGVTEGWSGPHEFGYFWNRWFPFEETHKLGEEQIARVDRDGLRREVAALASVYQLPMFFKSMLCSFQIRLLAEAFDTAVFVVCKRSPLFQAQSLLMARQALLGSKERWWSLRPKEYPELLRLPYHEQVVAQIFYTLEDIESQLAELDSRRRLDVAYETFCADPRGQVEKIAAAAGVVSHQCRWGTMLPEPFEIGNRQRLNAKNWTLLQTACTRYFGAV